MFNWLSEWNRKRKEEDHQKRYQAGYDWAHRALVAGRPIEEMESYINQGKDFDGMNAFDAGADKALFQWQQTLDLIDPPEPVLIFDDKLINVNTYAMTQHQIYDYLQGTASKNQGSFGSSN